MSRIGRLPIRVPPQVQVSVDGSNVVVKGPRGELSRAFDASMKIELDDGVLRVQRPNDAPRYRALHGLTRSLLANMVEGVEKGFSKTLELHGVGYRAVQHGEKIQLSLGLSHLVDVTPPAGVSFEVEGTGRVHVKGIDKELVGQVAAKIRERRPPEPYKGKGIRYAGEYVRRKAGKAGKAVR